MRPQLKADAELAIIDFIRSKVEDSGCRGVVVGLSGGIDSALVTKLCVDAIGPDKVLNIFLPSRSTPEDDRKDVVMLARHFGTELISIEIAPVLESYSKILSSLERKELAGNLMARIRMSVLYHHARMKDLLVMGTGNKSELLMGYFTKFGDGGADFLPIGDLYKTEVRVLARKMDIPVRIIEKTPSAGLWPGQTDEGEMGIIYEELDRILLGIELLLDDEVISSRTGLDLDLVRSVRSKHLASAHKRKMPLIPKLGMRTLGSDWRE
jgi:NAD+ synthase